MLSYDISTGLFTTSSDVWAELFRAKGTYDIIKIAVVVRSSDNTAIGFAECRVLPNGNLIVLDADWNNTIKFKLLKDDDDYYHFYAKSTYNSSYLYASVEYANTPGAIEVFTISPPASLPAYTDVSEYSIAYNNPISISIASMWTAVSGWTRSANGQVQYRNKRILGTLAVEGYSTGVIGGEGRTVADNTQIGTLPRPLYTETESLFIQVVAFYTNSDGALKPCLARIAGATGAVTVRKIGNDCGSLTTIYVPLNYDTTFSAANTIFNNFT